MNALAWKVRKWYVGMQLKVLRQRVRRLRRMALAGGRARRGRQLELPFRG